MNNKKTRVLFLALDSADPPLIRQMVAQNKLPNIGRLMRSGLSGRVDVPGILGNGVIWPTLNMGVNAGRHGRYYFTQIVPGSYETCTFHEDWDLAHAPFWKYLSDADKRVLVIDAYKAPLVRGLKGLQVLDWATHGFHPHNQPRSLPENLIKELEAKYGPDPVAGSVDLYIMSHPDIFELAGILVARCKAKTKYAIEQMQREPWSFAYIGFGEAHDIGHSGWHLHDQEHTLYDRPAVLRRGDPVEKVHAELDAAVGNIVDSVGDDTAVVLFAGTGMESNFSANSVLDRILSVLEQNGRSTESWVKSVHKAGRNSNYMPLVRLINHLPKRIRKLRVIKNLRKRAMARSRAARLCYALPYDDHCGAIRLNIRGREKWGKLSPGAEVDSFCQWLIRELMAITYEDTKEPLVKEVVHASEMFSGERVGHLPDLFVIWNRDRHALMKPGRSQTLIKSPTLGSLKIGPKVRTGDHTSEAMLILAGKGIPAGGNIAHIRLEDIAPTLCSLLGVVLPDSDGQVIQELGTGAYEVTQDKN